MHKPDYTVDWTDTEKDSLCSSRLVGVISRLMEEISQLVCMISRLIKTFWASSEAVEFSFLKEFE